MASLQNTSSHTPANRRKKLTTIIFDTTFFMRPKTRLLIKKGGANAVAVYLAAISWAGYEESSAVFPESAIELLAIDLDLTNQEVLDALEVCCFEQIGYLKKVEGGWFSQRLQKEIDLLVTKQENYRSGAAKRETKKNPEKSVEDSQGFSRILEVRKEQEQEQEKEQEEEKEQEQEPQRPKIPLKPPPTIIPSSPPEQKPDYSNQSSSPDWIENQLEPPENPRVSRSNLFMNCGRRPMKKYKNLWISPEKLYEVAQLYERSGIPPDQFHLGFRYVAARLDKLVDERKSLDHVDAYTWLIGFGLTEALKQRSVSLDVKRKEKYFEGARVT